MKSSGVEYGAFYGVCLACGTPLLERNGELCGPCCTVESAEYERSMKEEYETELRGLKRCAPLT